jgi:hypothetical protein
MNMAYSRECTINRVKQYLNLDCIRELYKQGFINWRGLTTDTEEAYSEVIAAYLLENDNHKAYAAIPTIPRNKSYQVESHDGKLPRRESKRGEERDAIKMFEKPCGPLGVMLDYQVPLRDMPLKDTANDKVEKVGKIDLVAYHEGDGILRIIEYKAQNSTETMLRCILEIYTYSRILDAKKLRGDFEYPRKKDKENCPKIRKIDKVVPAILVHACSELYQDYAYNKPPKVKVKELMQKLGIELFVISSGDCPENYVIEAVE